MDPTKSVDPITTQALEAAAFRRLVAHLDEHPEVQNIDLMNLAGFCRNCLSKWYKAARIKESIWIMKRLGRIFTVCLMQNGSSNIRRRHRLRNRPSLQQNTIQTHKYGNVPTADTRHP
jgi:hypothetical protein